MRVTCALRVSFLSAAMIMAALGQASPEHWVATWATAAQIYRAPAPLIAPAAIPPAATPATAATNTANPAPPRPRPPQSFNNQTVRMIVHTSLGGRRLRLQLTNPF